MRAPPPAVAPLSALLLAVISSACADVEREEPAQREQAVVYGADDRRDLYQLEPDSPLHRLARSVAAVIPRSAVTQGVDGELLLQAQSLVQTFSECPGQRFAAERGAAECTAFLIDDALLATAGHCFTSAIDCQKYLFVFDYTLAAPNEAVRLWAENVFECRRAQVRVDEMVPRVSKHDYAIVELTRRAVGREPLPIRSAPVALGEPVTVISALSGLPLKFDRGGRVLDERAHVRDFFRLDSDTSHGSSGAPVLDARGEVLGVAVRGRSDYLLDEQAGCFVENVVQPPALVPAGEMVKFPGGNELYSEEASPLADALVALCARPYPSPRLCARQAVCGDQSCSGDETFESCANDCSVAPPNRVAVTIADAGALPAADTPDAGEPALADAGALLPAPAPDAGGPVRARESCAVGPASSTPLRAGWLSVLALAFARRRRLRSC